MKQSIFAPVGYVILVILMMFGCREPDSGPQFDVRTTATDTLTIESVRKFSDRSVPGTILITDTDKQGVFKIDPADNSSADNTGTILVTANGARYKRDYAGSASTFWFDITTNDADIGPKLQTAVDAVSDLTFPDGTYTQQTEVRIHSNLSIRGNQGRVIINLTKSYVSLVNPVDHSKALENVLIDGLSWNVTTTGAGTYGVLTVDGPTVTNFTVQNCSSTDASAKDSTNFLTLKIQAGKTGNNIVVQSNYVQAKRMACEIFNHDNYGVYAGKNITVANNNFYNSRFGISLSGPLDGLTIDNNYLKNCFHYGVEIAGASHNVKITNNKFEGTFDKFMIGSNDGSGDKNGGTIEGGIVVTNNRTVGTCTGGVQFFNAGAATFTNNHFAMTGRLILQDKSNSGGTYADNEIESSSDIAIICDKAPNNTFTRNVISNQSSRGTTATFQAYGTGSTGIKLTGNTMKKSPGGVYYQATEGAAIQASQNVDGAGNPIP
jgi:hypothetical protein